MSHPVSDGKTPAHDRFRILSLDGGGIKGAFAAGFLAEIEEHTGKRIVDHFDLIAGTSTGGIIALAIGLGIPARDILSFYEAHGPDIFPASTWRTRARLGLRRAVRAKHSVADLRGALTEVFGERRIGEALTRLLVVSWDGVRGDVHVFKTAHSAKFTRDYKVTAVDAALATSAAPSYLPAFAGPGGVRFIDGGVWANCPAALAILEAIAVLGRAPHEVDILSVGTTEEPPRHLTKWRLAAGVLGWAPAMHHLLLEAQVRGSIAQANLLTEHRMIRVDHVVRPGRFRIDDSRGIGELVALGSQEARHWESKIAQTFLHSTVEPFAPCHRLG